MLKAIQKNQHYFIYAHDDLKLDLVFTLEAVKLNGMALRFIQPDFSTLRDIVTIAVHQNGIALRDASHRFQAEKPIVVAAVCQNGMALQFAHRSL